MQSQKQSLLLCDQNRMNVPSLRRQSMMPRGIVFEVTSFGCEYSVLSVNLVTLTSFKHWYKFCRLAFVPCICMGPDVTQGNGFVVACIEQLGQTYILYCLIHVRLYFWLVFTKYSVENYVDKMTLLIFLNFATGGSSTQISHAETYRSWISELLSRTINADLHSTRHDIKQQTKKRSPQHQSCNYFTPIVVPTFIGKAAVLLSTCYCLISLRSYHGLNPTFTRYFTFS